MKKSDKHKAALHIMYTINGTVHEAWKDWDFARIERVLQRMGATYWEIG